MPPAANKKTRIDIDTPARALDVLANSTSPFLIGIRHHSAACAAALPSLLDAVRPTRIFVELPAEMAPWLPWLGHPETVTPVALAASHPSAGPLGFYPFADFSPELAAIRWASARGVPIEPFDLPCALKPTREAPQAEGPRTSESGGKATGHTTAPETASTQGTPDLSSAPEQGTFLLSRLLQNTGAPDTESLWDRLVEARAPGSTPESLRRAALGVGWALRVDAVASGGVPHADLIREAYMRARLEANMRAHLGGSKRDDIKASTAPGPVAVVAGAFHIPALAADSSVDPSPRITLDPKTPPKSKKPRGRADDKDIEPVAAEVGRKRRSVARGLRALEPRALDPRALEPRALELHAHGGEIVTSLIPYSFPLLDARSGYPAGIRDPIWHQRVWETLTTVTRPDVSAIRSEASEKHITGELRETGGADGSNAPPQPAGTNSSTPDSSKTAAIEDVLTDLVVAICRDLRARGHVAGTPDAKVTLAMARDLARLRALPAPGRRELLEALEACLAQGDPLGRGRVLVRTLERVLIGDRRGRLAPGTPRSGLTPHVLELLAALRLPGPESRSATPTLLRLDPLRSRMDRRRHILLHRMSVCHIPYGTWQAGAAIGESETLTQRWSVVWTPATDAAMETAGIRGVTLAQTAEGTLLAEEGRLHSEGRMTAARRLQLLVAAAECGLHALVSRHLDALMGPFLQEAGLSSLVEAAGLLERLARGHIPGLPASTGQETTRLQAGDVPPYVFPTHVDPGTLLFAAVGALEGLAGSTRIDDARTLLELVRLVQARATRSGVYGDARLAWVLDQVARTGSPLMQGAAGAARVLLARENATAFGQRLGSWADAATTLEARRELSGRLAGALTVCAPLFESDPTFSIGLIARIDTLEDSVFLDRLPALRQGFQVLSPASRDRLLETIAYRLDVSGDSRPHADGSGDSRPHIDGSGDSRPHADGSGDSLRRNASGDSRRSISGTRDLTVNLRLQDDPVLMSHWAKADRAGREALIQAGLGCAEICDTLQRVAHHDTCKPNALSEQKKDAAQLEGIPAGSHSPAARFAPLDRWRLILGREQEALPRKEARLARALDELYGSGRGEGARGGLGGAGQEGAFPNVREWAQELEALFSKDVCEEVLGRAAEDGRAGALLALNDDTVTPSITLLEAALALHGGLTEPQLVQLRRLVGRVVDNLTRALATRVLPALTGLALPRLTRRPIGPLDLRRTVAANLRTARPVGSGGHVLAPEKFFFRTRGRRTMDWHIVLVVDVSGSMEVSVVYSAVMAAILNGVPALRVSFVVFGLEVIDLSEKVSDPLSLLLEIAVGGGTNIAKALRYARGLIRVPSRTMVVLVSDLEEGPGLGGLVQEVRELVATGAKPLGLAALDDRGQPRYCRAVAERVADAGMPVAALTPLELARWVAKQVGG